MLRELIEALKGLGQIERDLGRLEPARELYDEATSLCRQGQDVLLLAHTVRHLGDIHRSAGRPDLAEPCYDEALALYRGDERTDPLDLANAVRPLAILMEEAGQANKAASLWNEARELYVAAAVPAGAEESAARLARLGR